jgi:hypothetical protein
MSTVLDMIELHQIKRFGHSRIALLVISVELSPLSVGPPVSRHYSKYEEDDPNHCP